MQNNLKKSYIAPQVTALSAEMTNAQKQTPSTIEQQNPGMSFDPMFGSSAIS
jgi:hypothetical protein